MKTIIFTFFLFSSVIYASGFKPQEIYEKAVNSVFYVICKDAEGSVISSGSAVYIEGNRLVTNYHVVNSSYEVFFIKDEDTIKNPDYLGIDSDNDVAVFFLETDKFKPLKLRNFYNLKVGETVYALGNPDNLINSFSPGIISGLRKGKGFSKPDEIQFTAGIYFGSSGGALLDENCNIIGITTKGMFFGDLYFAIPADLISGVELIDHRDSVLQKNLNLYCRTFDFDYFSCKNDNDSLDLDTSASVFSEYQPFLKELMKLHLNREDVKRASETAQHLNKETIGRGKYYCYLAKMYESERKYDSAYLYYSLSILEEPNETILYLYRGWINSMLEQYKEALDDYNKAFSMDKSLSYFRFSTADIFLKMGDTANALKEIDETNSLYNSSETCRSRADYYFKMKDYSSALENYTFAINNYYTYSIDLEPMDAGLYFSRAVCYSKIGQHINAINDYLEYIRFEPHDARAYNNLGYEYMDYGEPEEAVKYFQHALSLNKNHFDSYLGLAILSYLSDREYEIGKYIYHALKIKKGLSKGINYIYKLEKRNYFWDNEHKMVLNEIFRLLGFPYDKNLYKTKEEIKHNAVKAD